MKLIEILIVHVWKDQHNIYINGTELEGINIIPNSYLQVQKLGIWSSVSY